MHRFILVLLSIVFLSSSRLPSFAKEISSMQEIIHIPIATIPVAYAPTVISSANIHKVPVWILARVIEKESNWRPHVVNKNRNGTKDIGIAQFNSAYLSDYYWFDNNGKKFNPLIPEEAIPVASRYLRRLYNATNDWWLAVAAYECGLTRVMDGRIPKQTVKSTDKVMYGWYFDR